MPPGARRARAHLREIFDAGLARVRGRDAVRDYFAHNPRPPTPVYLVAVGKAASAMTLGALDVLGAHVKAGLVITKHGHVDAELAEADAIECLESDHPIPGAASLGAGAALLARLDAWARPDARFLFLLSGGASSIVEAPAPPLQLADLARLTQTLLDGGLDIARMNTVRRALSRIKGGRLAAHLRGCPTLNLLISDVPGDDPGVIGSGLLTPVRETLRLQDYPAPVAAALRDVQIAPVPEEAAFAPIATHIVARLEDAKQACAHKARALGYPTLVADAFLDGDANDAARMICRDLCAGRRGVHIWGGETLMRLPPDAGRGGRNQHLALAAAVALRGRDDVFVLAAGTDGTDGPTDAAGGLVDGATIARGEAAGQCVEDSLARADSGTFLDAAGDLVTTGPTGTNVMDLVIGLRT